MGDRVFAARRRPDYTSEPVSDALGARIVDVGIAALNASGNPKDKQAVADSVKTLKVETPIGVLEWGKFPIPNVVPTMLVNGQWVKGEKYPFDWVCVDNVEDPNIPVQTELVPYA